MIAAGAIVCLEDCAGLGTFSSALSDAIASSGHPFLTLSSSEAEVKLHDYLVSVHGFQVLDSDARDKTILQMPMIASLRFDFYGSGFPCQPWSAGGPGLGASDPRASVHRDVMPVVCKQVRPKRMILENTIRFDAEFEAQIRPLWEQCQFVVVTLKLNSSHWVPQERLRFFAVAEESCSVPDVNAWRDKLKLLEAGPVHVQPLTFKKWFASVNNTLTWQVVADLNASKNGKVWSRNMKHLLAKAPALLADSGSGPNDFVADMGASKQRPCAMLNVSPTVTKARAEQNRLYIFDASIQTCSVLSVASLALLQGWNRSSYKKMANFIEPALLAGALGNGMTKPVLGDIIRTMLG